MPHHLHRVSIRNVAIVLLGLAVPVCREARGQASMQFPSGDSISILGTGPAVLPNRPTGILVDYNPFLSINDTVALKREALELWSVLRPHVDSSAASFVVLRAIGRAPELVGYQNERAYGLLIEKRGDGKWYLLHEVSPLQEH